MFTRNRWARRGPMLRTAPVEPGAGTADNGGAPAVPAAPPAAPAAFDPATLTPEARAYVDAQLKAEREKSRGYDKANAAKAATDELTKRLAEALGIAPKEADPAKLQAEITALQQRNTELAIDRELDRAAGQAGADADLIGALLARQRKLEGLDPSASDFATRVKTLVDEAVAANPRLKLDTGPAAPAPGGSAPVAPMAGGGGEGRKRPGSIQEALTAARAAK